VLSDDGWEPWQTASMSERRLLRLVVAAGVLAAFLAAGMAQAAYPPGGGSAPKAKCSISTIVNRRVAVSCNASKAQVGKRCSLKVRTSIVARGKVGKDGRYAARFTVAKLLTRGTKIFFLVEGKTAATVRV
jgi:hypothetical protein